MADEIYPSVRKILEAQGEKLVNALIANLKKYKVKASGNLDKSIHFLVQYKGDSYTFQLKIADYYYWIDKGRGKSKGGGKNGKLSSLIEKWIRDKGINIYKDETATQKKSRLVSQMGKTKAVKKLDREKRIKQIAFLIARKIHKEGYKGRPFYSDAVNKKWIDGMKADLKGALKRDVIIEIKNN